MNYIYSFVLRDLKSTQYTETDRNRSNIVLRLPVSGVWCTRRPVALETVPVTWLTNVSAVSKAMAFTIPAQPSVAAQRTTWTCPRTWIL